MRVADLSQSDFVRRAQGAGVFIQTGPFLTHLGTDVTFVAEAVHLLYRDFTLIDDADFADFHVRLTRPRTLRRWYHPQVNFYLDEDRPFTPLPMQHAYAMFEWCLNWSIETYAHQYVIIHAAVIERDGKAAILAAPPGSGKSTLTAALVCRGWRLLSDELTLLEPATGMAVPLCRPVGLKNESINVIRTFEPGCVIGPIATDTIKGTVAHMQPPSPSVAALGERAKPHWVIFPKYTKGSAPQLSPHLKATALLRLADNTFNYSYLGEESFTLLADLIDRCDCFQFEYSKLEDAIELFESLRTPVSMARSGR